MDGNLVRITLSRGLARAWRRNRGKRMTEQQAIEFVERERRERALRSAKPYLLEATKTLLRKSAE